MKKIAIIGNSGSGKTTLSCKLHDLLKIPVIHLDLYCWKSKKNNITFQDYQKLHCQFCNQKKWIIEGMGIEVLEYRIQKADSIIFLNYPIYVCLFRGIRRKIKNFIIRQKDKTRACPDTISFKYLKQLWIFNKNEKIIIENLIKKYKDQKQFFIIKNQRNLTNLLNVFLQ